MTDETKKTDLYVFSVDAVRRSIDSLLKEKTHEHLPGYLAILRSQKQRAGSPSLPSDILDLYDRYLKVMDVNGHPPYLRPFVSRGRNVWFNQNVAGSYAPGNVRADPGPFFRVIDVVGNGLGTTYLLSVDHAARASKHLFQGHKLPIAALAAFMYRDYGFSLEAPSIASIVNIFRDEFYLRMDDTGQAATFDTLFYDDSADFAAATLEILQA